MVDLTTAFVGTRVLFEAAGLVKVADTASVSAGFPRIVVRRPTSTCFWTAAKLVE